MKFELIDQAYNIPNFDNQATELVAVLNKPIHGIEYGKEHSTIEHTKLIHYGFKLSLDMIAQYPEMIRPTLYQTMIAVREKYRQLTKFSYNHLQISAVSLAVNHIQFVARFVINKQLKQSYVEKYKQQKRMMKC